MSNAHRCQPKRQADIEEHEAKEELQSLKYWAQQEGSVDGVMGGFGHLDAIDTKDSCLFVRKVRTRVLKLQQRHGGPEWVWGHAADLGAGIGRCTKEVLSKFPFQRFSIYEPVNHLLQEAKRNLGHLGTKVEFTQCTLQDFDPLQSSRFDLIWIQWVSGQLE
eukprot:Gregarina_sp_Poly_1__6017@NODE_3172_length_1310_cov_52_258246_g1701_i2_p1_GENE_NODE_3172_length_1310_cov_52_258246_g1701_i2NODE_3172_length_1310_cov_52_258246_g1701_i2_p1_ORF_typecomplete_len162_score17_93Methyltransf_PK/PF05891_12/5_1e32Methyltransf_25/PF13649_6/1_3e02Methyltransf_25/PF13649_6/5_1e08Methyltransf_11/PF08241_12/6_7e06Methyltransf_12/PF08242_12/2_7e03Methyltransf_12/PF08242_12/3e05Methyltransf_31/PF13847_6/5_1e05MTS/PF05175_14/4_3e05NodS/PF05401_11/0_00021Methyltransf_2/PF00891_18